MGASVTAIVLAGLLAVASVPALAGPPADRNPTSPGLGWGPGGSRSAPAPPLGAGLPALLLGGAYLVYRVRRRS
jgi:hypothetical protein